MCFIVPVWWLALFPSHSLSLGTKLTDAWSHVKVDKTTLVLEPDPDMWRKRGWYQGYIDVVELPVRV